MALIEAGLRSTMGALVKAALESGVGVMQHRTRIDLEPAVPRLLDMLLHLATRKTIEAGDRHRLCVVHGIEGYLAQAEASGCILPYLACLAGRLDPI
jgi:hypothetical protein